MFDLGFPELLVIGTVALIVVGPKDLPKLFQTVGQFVGKAKGMAREFSGAMNAAANESGLNEINQTIKAASNPTKFGAAKIREASGIASPDAEAEADTSETGKLKSKLSAERAANAKKINEAMTKAAEDRKASEAAQAAAENAPKAAKPAAAKTTTTKAAPKKAAAKKAAPKATAAKKAAPKKAAPKKASPKAKTPAKDAK